MRPPKCIGTEVRTIVNSIRVCSSPPKPGRLIMYNSYMSIMVLSQHRTNGIKKIISSVSHRRHNVYSAATARGAGFYYSTLNRRLARDSFMVVKAPPPIFIARNDRSTFNRARGTLLLLLYSILRVPMRI